MFHLDRFLRFSVAVETLQKAVNRYKNACVSRFGLHGMHVTFLCTLSKCEGGMTATELSKSCSVDKAFISRTGTELREMGLVSYVSGEGQPVSGYKNKICLTDKGWEVMREISDMVMTGVGKATKDLAPEILEQFYEVIDSIDNNLTLNPAK